MIFSPAPAIGTDGTIYAESGDKNIYAINPDGSFKWGFTTKDGVWSSPVISSDGTVIYECENYYICAMKP